MLCGVLGTEEERCVEGKGAEERSWDASLCFCCSHSLLQSGGRLASIIIAVSLSLSLSLCLSLFHMRALVRSLARLLSALDSAFAFDLTYPPPPLLFLSDSSQSEYKLQMSSSTSCLVTFYVLYVVYTTYKSALEFCSVIFTCFLC